MLSPSELLARLAALVPPKGFNLTRYHGCLAPRSSIRDLIVPAPAPDDPWKSPTGDEPVLAEGEPHQPPATIPTRPRRIPWAELLRGVFRVDIEQCHCGGRLKLVAFVTDPGEARRYLCHVGLPSEPPAIAPARAPPQAELAIACC